ncbi:hypothetical protein CDV36_001127 [Fusarium kuroshium]|uniref:Uncharacterized protein n=1 Tax=Fusarium kuroshium TaxID=2010991 RepID=A0A3M2SNY1_9HYPO|nr:hypothetical protein CDV36_001127 [Fusarium kuroshium]
MEGIFTRIHKVIHRHSRFYRQCGKLSGTASIHRLSPGRHRSESTDLNLVQSTTLAHTRFFISIQGFIISAGGYRTAQGFIDYDGRFIN